MENTNYSKPESSPQKVEHESLENISLYLNRSIYAGKTKYELNSPFSFVREDERGFIFARSEITRLTICLPKKVLQTAKAEAPIKTKGKKRREP